MKVTVQPCHIKRNDLRHLVGIAGGKYRLRFGWVNYFIEAKLQYLFSDPSLMGILKEMFKMLLSDLVQHPLRTLKYGLLSLELESDVIQGIALSIENSNQKMKYWVSRQAILGNFPYRYLDARIDFDFFRDSKITSLRIWQTDLSPTKITAETVLKQNNWTVDDYSIANIVEEPTLEVLQLKDVTIHHGTTISQNNVIFPLDFSQIGLASAWPNDKPIQFRERLMLLNTSAIGSLSCATFIGHSQNWYHFIIEFIPRYLMIPKNMRNNPVIIPREMHKQMKELLSTMGFTNFFEISTFDRLHVKKLFTVRDFRFHNSPEPKFRSYDIQKLQEVFSKLNTRESTSLLRGQDKVCIARPKHLFRQISNIDSFFQALSRKGFSIFYPEALEFRQQLELFRNASFVIGESGAALTSLIFSKKFTKVLEIQNSSKNPDTFWQDYCGILELSHQKVMSKKYLLAKPFSGQVLDIDATLDKISENYN